MLILKQTDEKKIFKYVCMYCRARAMNSSAIISGYG